MLLIVFVGRLVRTESQMETRGISVARIGKIVECSVVAGGLCGDDMKSRQTERQNEQTL
jgi:hypothetical protein